MKPTKTVSKVAPKSASKAVRKVKPKTVAKSKPKSTSATAAKASAKVATPSVAKSIPTKVNTSNVIRKALIADDEPEHLEWLVDFLKAKSWDTTVVTNVKDAIAAAQNTEFGAYIIDLNIPLGGWVPALPNPVSSQTYRDYGGFYIIKVIRSRGKLGYTVIAYSAHKNEQIVAEIKKLYCEYVVKGRPRELKALLSANLQVS